MKSFINKAFLLSGITVILMFPVYLTALWVASGYDANFLKIDSCLDEGGVWDKEESVCKR